ncbi:hypothetical protein JDV02_005625 [Purpureocillium takamizusanense]|uniref:Enoyl-CoA hydratase n=1 Tax=Purpureocillium takamizusanense TaxID=2060973 RepID=A0A9Q8QIF7_9HYPO|nr:uncharacterized protein JDV02_005625 [Purpureocillium takamizusanense]UNI19441.1 hypothetical protein JDV02_005625 [Purpureocillium takamizusanense]
MQIMGRALLRPFESAWTTVRRAQVHTTATTTWRRLYAGTPALGVHAPRRCMSTETIPLAEQQQKRPAAGGGDGDVLCSVDAAPPGGEGTVATVTLSNPRRLNSLSGELIAKLTSTLRSLADEPDVRCVVIQGAAPAAADPVKEEEEGKKKKNPPPSFTTGANIFEMARLQSYDDAKAFITALHRACQAVRHLPVPSIARIHGLCLGGGLELAAACDFRYATRASTFGMPEARYGVPSVVEARLLANIVGWQRAKEMVYFARIYGAPEMERWGLVDGCCATVEELDGVVAGAVAGITALGPGAVREQKRLVRIWEESDLGTGIEAGVDSFARMFSDGGEEPARYMKAFTERKK